MPGEPARRPTSSLLGLLLVLAGVILGITGLQVAHHSPSSTWVLDACIVLAIGGLALYAGAVYLPQRRLESEHAVARTESERMERGVDAALAQLKTGDLVAAAAAADTLSSRLAHAFANSAHALGILVEHIQGSSIEVAAAGNAVNTTASELASGSSEQAAAVVEITASMEELARTAAQIAHNAANQAELANRAEASGNSGAGAVEAALHGVEEVQQRISAIASRADTLGSRSREIYRVLDLINDIAQETHILSLNAAIEAAAAGEHGRRFSIVADEVRRLAQRSRESVDSVRTLLDEFAGSIRATVVATEEGGKEAFRVLERARAAAAAIDDLRDALATTARTARETSLATEQQRSASDQVVLTLKEVSQVIQRMADGLKQFSGTAERLNQLALSIQLLTQSFHLDSPHSLKHVAERCTGELSYRAGNWETLAGQLDGILHANPFLEMAYVVDAGGGMLGYAVSPELARAKELPAGIAVGASFADRPWFQAVTRDGHTILTPLYESLLTGARCFTVAAPVRDGDQRLVAVLGFDVNARSWTRI